eukprot:gene6945-8286_t
MCSRAVCGLLVLLVAARASNTGCQDDYCAALEEHRQSVVDWCLNYPFGCNHTSTNATSQYSLSNTTSQPFEIYVFMDNDAGRLGLGHEDRAKDWTMILRKGIPKSEGFVKTSVAASNTYVLTDQGNVYGVGSNEYGQLGTNFSGTAGDEVSLLELLLTPMLRGDMSETERVIDIVSGVDSVLLLTDQNNVYGAGHNAYGQLGLNSSGHIVAVPTLMLRGDIPADEKVTNIYGYRANHYALLTNASKLYAMGSNNYGQLGIGSEVDKTVPTLMLRGDILEHEIIVDVRPAGYRTTIRTDVGALYSTGFNSFGAANSRCSSAFLRSDIRQVNVPTRAHVGVSDFFATDQNGYISASGDNAIYAIGRNYAGALGINITDICRDKLTPMVLDNIPEGDAIVQIASEGTTTLLRTESGNIYGTGRNNLNQLNQEDSSTTIIYAPVLVPTDTLPAGSTIVGVKCYGDGVLLEVVHQEE